MKASTLLQHIGIALLLTFLATINDTIFRQFMSGLFSIKLNIASSIFLYLVFIIWQSRVAAGKITLLLIDLSLLLISLFTNLSSVSLILIGLLLIWLNRCLLCYSSLLTVFADFALCLLSAFVVYSLLSNGHSLMTALWCLLLLQSLHCLFVDKKMASKLQASPNDNFEQALQSAENALQQLIR